MRSVSAQKPATNPSQLLSDAEGGEDQVQDVVGSGLAGERVQSPERAIEIEQDHLVGNAGGVGCGGVGQAASAVVIA